MIDDEDAGHQKRKKKKKYKTHAESKVKKNLQAVLVMKIHALGKYCQVIEACEHCKECRDQVL